MQQSGKLEKLVTEFELIGISMKTTLWMITIGGLIISTATVSAQNTVDPFIDPAWPTTAAKQRRERLGQLEQRRLIVLQEFTPNSPKVRDLERQIARLKLQIKWGTSTKPNLDSPPKSRTRSKAQLIQMSSLKNQR